MLLEFVKEENKNMLEIKARQGLEKVEEYKVETVPNANIVVNANESNWNLPKDILLQVQHKTQEFVFNRYPPMGTGNLGEVLAADLQVDPDKIIIGNGSSELLEKACFAFGGAGRKIAFPSPSFSMYGVYVQMADSISVPYALTAEGYVDADAVIDFCAKEKPSLLIICNPNNPTGNFNSLEKMEKILNVVSCPVIMDEAYMEFAQEPEAGEEISTLSLLDKYNNFLCFRTFSKAYGLAGLRVGYGIGSGKLISIIQKVLMPYHVNSYSLMVAQVAYENKTFFRERVQLIRSERNKMRGELAALGFRVFPSETNFLLFLPTEKLACKLAVYAETKGYQFTGNNANKAGTLIFQELLEQKILVRNFSGNAYLAGGIRLTMGTETENVKVLAAIKEICKNAEE